MDTAADAPLKTFGAHPDTPPPHMLTGVRFNLVRLNERTNDGRLLRDTGFAVRDLPVPFSMMTSTMHGAPGVAEIIGSLDAVEVHADGTVVGRGWLMDLPHARMGGRMIQAGALRGNSVELSVKDYEVDFEEASEKILVDFTDYQISATTLVGNPAMEFCTVELEDEGFDFGALEMPDEMLAAAASFTAGAYNPILPGVQVPEGVAAFSVMEQDVEAELSVEVPTSAPPAEWFDDPCFNEVTPGRIMAPDEHGRMEVYGHIAAWDLPHLGVPGMTLMAPKSKTGYAYFANGETLCADGSFVPTGVLTFGGSHAEKGLNWRLAQAHYDDACAGWAAVAVGEDNHGIWYHGYVLPGTEDDTVARCRSLGVSGDWRRVRGNLELVAVLSVNARGFPLARPSAFSSGGLQTALIGAGAVANVENTLAEGYVPLDPESRIAINVVANFARKTEAREIRDALLADQRAELAHFNDAFS